MSRRQLLQAGLWGFASAVLSPTTTPRAGSTRILRLALLHLAPKPGNLSYNRELLQRSLIAAAERRAAWVLTPELTLTGYTFAEEIGTDWILPQPDPWVTAICRLCAQLNLTVFLSVPERDPNTQKLHNSVCVIAPDGNVIGCHRKINTLRVGSEAWSSPGEHLVPLPVPPFDRVGILICADAFSGRIYQSLKAQGAQVFVSSAAWAPGLHGPNGEWERCTVDTGLPLFVCNRTGLDRTLDFTAAQSVVVMKGRRLLSLSARQSAIFFIDWDVERQALVTQDYETVFL